MPYLSTSSYKAPRWLPGGHAQTIFPSLCRKMAAIKFDRMRFSTPDQDFLTLDTLRAQPDRAERAVILSHGLEGDSRRKYMRGMALTVTAQGWDSINRNFRCCGGEANYGPTMYHSGETDDLHTVINYCLRLGYRKIMLVGFSMGGNQVLKYLGENPQRVPPEVEAAAVFSVPCHLPGAATRLDSPENKVYMRYFLKTLRQKIHQKHANHPYLYPLKGLDSIRTFGEFDERYTAPIHGFSSALDYWQRASCLPFLGNIRVPTLLVNARNDPFLSPECYPREIAESSPLFFLETPAQGGHVGFTSALGVEPYWSETRAISFLTQHQRDADAATAAHLAGRARSAA
jgi:predicted alpha/beta-fold hydrolase